MQAEIVIERATVHCWTAYCLICEEGTIVPFLRAREIPNPVVQTLASGQLESYRAAEAAVQAWGAAHVHEAVSASVAAG